MTKVELQEWAEQIVASDPDGKSHVTAEVAPAVLREFAVIPMTWDQMRSEVAAIVSGYVYAAIREDRQKFLNGIKDCMEPALFLEIEQAVNRNNVLGKRIDPARAERERIVNMIKSSNPPILGDEVAEAIAKCAMAPTLHTVLAERERCAKVAELYSSRPNDPSWIHCETGALEAATADAIAAAIRSGR